MIKQDNKDIIIKSIIIGGALLCFAYIAYMISSYQVLNFDTVIREWVYAHRAPFLNKIFITITYLGNWQTITALALIILLVKKTRREIGVPFIIVSISSTLIYKILKTFFQRPRPEMAVRIIKQGGFSFPSGHSMNCIVCYGILIYLILRYCKNRRLAKGLTAILTILIVGIGVSRVYVGVHFPTDILGGWSMGAAVLCAAIIVIEKIRGKKNDI